MKLNLKIALNMTLFVAILIGAQSASAAFCWKSSWGRGVGTVPGSCAPDQQKSLLLCYLKCKPGFFMSDALTGTCQQECPQGWGQTVAHCTKPGSYGRGEYENTWADWNKDKCEAQAKAQGKAGCEKWGALWYHKCKPGFHAVGCCVCSPDCPAGMTDIGVGCTKNNYTLPPITPSCGPGQVYDAGLCYKPCNPGEYGVGPVCYKRCPAGMVACGASEELSAACASTATECVTKIGEMLVAVGSVVYKVADAVITGGGFSNLTQIAKDAAVNTLKQAAKNVAKEVANMTLDQIKDSIRKQKPDLPADAVDKLAAMEKNPEGFDYVGFLTKVDPTGLAAVAKSFIHGICP